MFELSYVTCIHASRCCIICVISNESEANGMKYLVKKPSRALKGVSHPLQHDITRQIWLCRFAGLIMLLASFERACHLVCHLVCIIT